MHRRWRMIGLASHHPTGTQQLDSRVRCVHACRWRILPASRSYRQYITPRDHLRLTCLAKSRHVVHTARSMFICSHDGFLAFIATVQTGVQCKNHSNFLQPGFGSVSMDSQSQPCHKPRGLVQLPKKLHHVKRCSF